MPVVIRELGMDSNLNQVLFLCDSDELLKNVPCKLYTVALKLWNWRNHCLVLVNTYGNRPRKLLNIIEGLGSR